MKKTIRILMIFGLCLSMLTGCAPSVEYFDATYPQENPEIKITVAQNGVTNYQIVIPDGENQMLDYASKELELYFENASGADIEIKSESEKSADKKYLSIGETALMQSAGINLDKNALGRDGFIIKTVNDAVYMCGGDDYGSLYAVYEFLAQTIDWETYAPDEIVFTKNQKVEMPVFDETQIPSIKNRTGGYYNGKTDAYFTAKMRTFANYGLQMFDKTLWGTWAHTFYTILNPNHLGEDDKTYSFSHPEWFQSGQLCLTNQEMRAEFAKRLAQIVIDSPDCIYFMIGQNDGKNYCLCNECARYFEQYKDPTFTGPYVSPTNRNSTRGISVLNMEFTNDIVRRVNEIVGEDRAKEITFFTFAYSYTQEAPVQKNADGSFTPLTNGVVAEDNLGILLAPYYDDWYHDILDEKYNSSSAKNIAGYKSICDKIIMWGYGNNFNLTLEWFDDFSSIVPNIKFIEENGGEWFFTENGSGTKQSQSFQAMRAFVYSKLQWNSSLDMNELIDEFMLNYYKVASSDLKEYWIMLRDYYDSKIQYFDQDSQAGVGTTVNFVYGKDKNEFNTLVQMASKLNGAIEKVKSAGYTQLEEFKLINRITMESLTVRYTMLEYFQEYMDNYTYLKLVEEFANDCNKFEIESLSVVNGAVIPLSKQISTWLNNKGIES